MHRITVLNIRQSIGAPDGANLLEVLRSAGLLVDAPCGGQGTCGKCTVYVDGVQTLACRTAVDRDLTVEIPQAAQPEIMTAGVETPLEGSGQAGFGLAFDIGTTTVAGYLLDTMTGETLASTSTRNPQYPWGADVISRIQFDRTDAEHQQTKVIRKCLSRLAEALCTRGGMLPSQVRNVCVVGNPAMQQLFLGMDVENLAQIPFAPVLTRGEMTEAAPYLPELTNAKLLTVPDISGYVGADTVACILATGMHEKEELSLLVDIGTNGEMVMGNRDRMVACAAAAGPALEGANIAFGMNGSTGAIDHVRWEQDAFRCSVIGGGRAVGICGSGIVDAVAAAMDAKLLNKRGRVLNEDHTIHLRDGVILSQADVRQVQLAKGAIGAGIQLMARKLGVKLEDVDTVYLAGAFGNFMDPDSACRIGLLPPVLRQKIRPVGNAAGSGARKLACRPELMTQANALVRSIVFLELASEPSFYHVFADHMGL